MLKTRAGDKVKIHYTSHLKNVNVIDSTIKEGPIEFTVGNGEVIPGLEKAVVGMKEGDVKSVHVSPKDAYGDHKSSLVKVVDREKLTGKINLQLGMKLKARTSTGILKDVTVCDISDSCITVDTNHPLAGQELTFEIILLEIMEH